MAISLEQNLQLNSEYTADTFASASAPFFPQPIVESGDTTIVTTINGAGGPDINFVSSIGFAFTGGTGGTVTMSVSNAALVRSSIGAAQSGANADLNTFSALTGSTGWSAWTGTPDKTTHATFSGTASVGYVQAEMQAVMDSLQEVTEAFMALTVTLLASGVFRP